MQFHDRNGASDSTPVDEGGKSSGMFWLRRDAENKIRFGHSTDPGSINWYYIATWEDDLVAYTRLQSPSWVRIKHVFQTVNDNGVNR